MKKVEVYKTNVDDISTANKILDEIRQSLPKSDPSFDMDDCDKVLRVENNSGIDTVSIVKIVHKYGFKMETLPF